MIATTSCRGSLRPALKYFGGKYPIANWIVSLMPEHAIYLEPFVGGGSVLLSKPPCEMELAFDLDAGLIRMWTALQAKPELVQATLRFARYGKETWEDAARDDAHEDPVIAAASRIIRSRWSRGGSGKHFGASTRLRGKRDEYVNSWETFRETHLPAVCERVKDVSFACLPFRKSIGMFASGKTLVYCDPPYHPSTRATAKAYEHEMSDKDHRDLLDLVNDTPSMVMLSGYRCELYDDALNGWNRHDKAVANHASQSRSKSRRVESVWTNF